VQVAHCEGEERAIRSEIGAEQDGAWLNPGNPQSILKVSRRHVHHGNCLAHERQRRPQLLESLDSARDRQVASCAPRGHSQLRQVRGQSLLQLTRPS